MEVFIGSIVAFGFNFQPRGWLLCAGQMVSIAEYTTLYSLLGTTYGGDGVTTFGIPNLQSKVPLGQTTQTSNYVMGQTAGSNNVTLLTTNLPAHTHTGTVQVSIRAYSDSGNTTNPQGGNLAVSTGVNMYTSETPDVALAPFSANTTVGVAGASIPFDVTDPYLGINYSIAAYGIFPSRN